MTTNHYDDKGKLTGRSEQKTFLENFFGGVDDVCHYFILTVAIIVFIAILSSLHG